MRLDLKLQTPDDPLTLRPRRVHEVEGPGRRLFALLQAARHKGPIFWILPAHVPEGPMLWGLPQGVADRLHLIRAKGEIDLLWAAEEALRSATVGAVLAEPEKPMGLTAGRRLQLAAEAGRTLGLMLIRQGQGSNATETRWHCTPVPAEADSTLQRWSLIKNKSGTSGVWTVNWDGASAAFHLVPEAGERPRPAEPPL
jgi:protein ImuA